ncbi:Uncharacterised protein [Mycobacteroides abscessus]|nr:Uncharacterised protein [Mycobacteroides abscessus]
MERARGRVEGLAGLEPLVVEQERREEPGVAGELLGEVVHDGQLGPGADGVARRRCDGLHPRRRAPPLAEEPCERTPVGVSALLAQQHHEGIKRGYLKLGDELRRLLRLPEPAEELEGRQGVHDLRLGGAVPVRPRWVGARDAPLVLGREARHGLGGRRVHLDRQGVRGREDLGEERQPWSSTCQHTRSQHRLGLGRDELVKRDLPSSPVGNGRAVWVSPKPHLSDRPAVDRPTQKLVHERRGTPGVATYRALKAVHVRPSRPENVLWQRCQAVARLPGR